MSGGQEPADRAGEETVMEILRVSFTAEEDANSTATKIAEAGYEVAVVKERFAGEDDDEEVVFVVATPARLEQVADCLSGDYFVE